MLPLIALCLLAVSPELVPPGGDDTAAQAESLAAAKPDSLHPRLVEGVTVIATRLPLPRLLAPASVSVLEPDPASPAAGPADLVAGSPGISSAAHGGLGSIRSMSLRGSSSTDVLYLIDGVPQNSSRDGTFDLNRLPADISRVEVLRGPGAALYGANAAAGVVNFITAQPKRDRPFSRIRFQQGSSDQKTLEAFLARSLSKALAMELGASWDRTGGQRPNSDYDGLRYSLKIMASPSDKLSGNIGWRRYQSENGNPGALSWPTFYERQKDEQDDLNLSARYGRFELSASQGVSRRWLDADYGRTENKTTRRRVELSVSEKLWDRLNLLAGVSHQEDRDQNSASGDHSLDQSSAFLSQQADLPYGCLLAVSLRYDRTQAYPSQLSPNLSLGWSPDRRLSLHASYGRSYRAPTIVDLFWPAEVYPPYYGFVYKITGNPGLRPEKTEQLEMGARWSRGLLEASAAYFQRKTRDLIDWTHIVFVPPDTTHNFPENVGRVTARGLEAAAALRPLEWLRVEASLTHCRTAEDSSGGRVLPYKPLNVASARLGLGDFRLAGALSAGWSLTLRYSDRQVVRHASDWTPGLELPRFLVADQTVSLKLRDARLYYTVENLGNALYQTRYDYPMPRRSHLFGIAVELWD